MHFGGIKVRVCLWIGYWSGVKYKSYPGLVDIDTAILLRWEDWRGVGEGRGKYVNFEVSIRNPGRNAK